MTIDFKGFFRNKNHRQRKINNLGRLESRRWAKSQESHNRFHPYGNILHVHVYAPFLRATLKPGVGHPRPYRA